MSVDTRSDQSKAPTLHLPSGQTIDLDRPVTIGRAADNDVVLQHPSVSRYHCAITPQNGTLVLTDRESANGTFVNGQDRIAAPHLLQDGDHIQVGELELHVQWPERSPLARAAGAMTIPFPAGGLADLLGAAPVAPVRTTKLYLRRGPEAPRILEWDPAQTFSIGRSEDSSLLVNDGAVSRHHADIEQRDGSVVVSDLGSANGTFVNGGRVEGRRYLQPGDAVTAGPVELVYDPDAAPEAPAVLAFDGPGQEGREFPLNRDVIIVGRSDTADVVLPDPSVSRDHARIERFASDYWLFPTSERQAVMVNGEPVTGPALLRSGDRLGFGEMLLVFRQQDVADRRHARVTEALTLRQAAPFADLDQGSFNSLLQAGKEVTFEAGALILEPEKTKKGKKAKKGTLVVILEGEAEVRGQLGDEDATDVVVTLAPGDYCGERSLAFGQPYPYRVMARSRVRAFRLDQADMMKLLRGLPLLGGFFRDKVARHGMVKYLRQIPLFDHVPDEKLPDLVPRLKQRSFPAGDVLARKDEICRTLFVIATGSCRVNSVQRGELVTLTHLTEGKFVGEQMAGAEEGYPYTLVAETAGEAFTLSRDDYLAFAQEAPESFDFGPAGVPPSVILQRTPPFNDLAPELVAEAARALRIKTFREGETIIYQDDPAGSAFYIIAKGRVDVLFRNQEGQERSLAKLMPGQAFGEAALLTGSPRNATVKALEDCQLLTLYRREFNEIVQKAPQRLGQFFSNTHNARFRPKRIPNVEVFEQHTPAGVSYILKNELRNNYINLSEQGLFVFNMLDGEHTMNDIAAAYYRQFKSMAMGPMIQSIMELQQLGFLDVSTEDLLKQFDTGEKPPLSQRLLHGILKVLNAKAEFRRAHDYFAILYNRFARIFFTKPFLALITLINIAGLATFVYVQITGENRHLEVNPVTAVSLALLQMAMITTHEMGHGITMIHIGRRVLGAGIGLLFGIALMAFVNTTDAWMATKKQRLAVTAGGLVMTSTQAAIASLLIPFVGDGTLRTLLFEMAFIGYILFAFNCNPLFPTDGYNFLMDMLTVPDLRPKALRYLFTGGLFRGLITRKFQGEEKALAVFGVGVIVFMLFVIFNTIFVAVPLISKGLGTFLPDAVVQIVSVPLVIILIGMFVLPMLKEAGILGKKS